MVTQRRCLVRQAVSLSPWWKIADCSYSIVLRILSLLLSWNGKCIPTPFYFDLLCSNYSHYFPPFIFLFLYTYRVMMVPNASIRCKIVAVVAVSRKRKEQHRQRSQNWQAAWKCTPYICNMPGSPSKSSMTNSQRNADFLNNRGHSCVCDSKK